MRLSLYQQIKYTQWSSQYKLYIFQRFSGLIFIFKQIYLINFDMYRCIHEHWEKWVGLDDPLWWVNLVQMSINPFNFRHDSLVASNCFWSHTYHGYEGNIWAPEQPIATCESYLKFKGPKRGQYYPLMGQKVRHYLSWKSASLFGRGWLIKVGHPDYPFLSVKHSLLHCNCRCVKKGFINDIKMNNGIQYIKMHVKLNKVILFPH
jgi:hypothetical protein